MPANSHAHRREMDRVIVLGALVATASLWIFLEVWDEVADGEIQHVEESILRWCRRADDPATPRGPAWLREAALDATALGSHLVLTLAVIAVTGYLWIHDKRRLAGLIVLTAVTGTVVTQILKWLFGRERPDVVPHLREVSSASFPSGHAALSAVVYLTLGLLLATAMTTRRARLYCLAWALAFTILVGLSRIFLGVHYPTDVLGGWTFGLAWALAGWTLVRWLHWHDPSA